MILLAACFLFFCSPVHHARHHHVVTKPPQQSCEQITKDRDKWDRQDDWVSQFPVAQQHRVLQCLSKSKK
jgi:hypothetical protein